MEAFGVIIGEKIIHIMPDQEAMYLSIILLVVMSTTLKIPGIQDIIGVQIFYLVFLV
jgi:hypothetical protein